MSECIEKPDYSRPQYRGPETFALLRLSWDVSKAWDLVAADKIEHQRGEVDINEAAKMLGMIGHDRDYVEQMDAEDLKYPILIVNVEDVGNMVIDGWHKIAAAKRLGVNTLTCVYLPDDSEVQRHPLPLMADEEEQQ
jgi:hypothetical protein